LLHTDRRVYPECIAARTVVVPTAREHREELLSNPEGRFPPSFLFNHLREREADLPYALQEVRLSSGRRHAQILLRTMAETFQARTAAPSAVPISRPVANPRCCSSDRYSPNLSLRSAAVRFNG